MRSARERGLKIGERALELLAGTRLELAGALPGDAQPAAELREGELLVGHHPLLDDEALAGVEGAHRGAHPAVDQVGANPRVVDLVLRGAVVFEQLEAGG